MIIRGSGFFLHTVMAPRESGLGTPKLTLLGTWIFPVLSPSSPSRSPPASIVTTHTSSSRFMSFTCDASLGRFLCAPSWLELAASSFYLSLVFPAAFIQSTFITLNCTFVHLHLYSTSPSLLISLLISCCCTLQTGDVGSHNNNDEDSPPRTSSHGANGLFRGCTTTNTSAPRRVQLL